MLGLAAPKQSLGDDVASGDFSSGRLRHVLGRLAGRSRLDHFSMGLCQWHSAVELQLMV